jgi:hypothetical protein
VPSRCRQFLLPADSYVRLSSLTSSMFARRGGVVLRGACRFASGIVRYAARETTVLRIQLRGFQTPAMLSLERLRRATAHQVRHASRRRVHGDCRTARMCAENGAKKISPPLCWSASDGGGTVARDRSLKGTARGAIVTRREGCRRDASAFSTSATRRRVPGFGGWGLKMPGPPRCG